MFVLEKIQNQCILFRSWTEEMDEIPYNENPLEGGWGSVEEHR